MKRFIDFARYILVYAIGFMAITYFIDTLLYDVLYLEEYLIKGLLFGFIMSLFDRVLFRKKPDQDNT